MMRDDGDPKKYGLGAIVVAFLLGAALSGAGGWLVHRAAAPLPVQQRVASKPAPPVILNRIMSPARWP